jgi:hypothetical protein
MRYLSLLLVLLANLAFAQQQVVGIGAAPDDGTGDPARTAFDKLNDNDTELYTRTEELATVTDDHVYVANGTGIDAKALADCDDTAGNHLNYDTATNTFSCGTSGDGGGATTGTGTLTFTDACSTDLTQAFSYTVASSVVTLFLGATASCTGDSNNFLTAAGALPVAIRPSATTLIPSIRGTDAGQPVNLCAVILADGTFAYRKGTPASSAICLSGVTWTSSGSRAANDTATSITYRLN